MLISLTRKIRSGYVVAFLLLLISYILIFMVIRKVRTGGDWVSHSFQVMNKLQQLRGDITDAEVGTKGYIITNDVHFLKSYNANSKTIPVNIKELQQLTADNKTQQNKLDTLSKLINQELFLISKRLTNFQQSGFKISEEMIAQQQSDKVILDSVLVYIQQLNANEKTLMESRQDKLSDFFTTTEIITVCSLIIALITVIFSLVIYNRENKAREEADRKTSQYRTELETNISELKKMNEELQELKANEKFSATGRIARTIAHEVRNPLTNISLAAEQLQEKAIPDADSSVLLDMITRNAGRINQLVSDLLNATRFVQLEFRKTNINDLLEEALEMAQDRIGLKQIQVERFYADDLCDVSVDREKIKLALLNLIVNATEAMEKNKGVLQLKTRKQGTKCIIEVKDNGTGMDEETLQKIFEPYFTGKPKGNGLGLTNTQNIILNHNGSIKVYSKPGQGATFMVILDIHK